jgi:hypothetical protein
MKSRKFPSLEAAQEYMRERGELKYFGREGTDARTYVYTLTIGVKVYHILLVENGTLFVMDERYI